MMMNETDFYRYLAKSALFHIAVFLLFWGAGYILYSATSGSQLSLSAIQTAVRVDVVAMPRMSLQELQALEKIAKTQDLAQGVEEAVSLADDSESVKLLKEKERADFLEMLKKIGKKKASKPEDRAAKGIDRKMQKELNQLLVAGNKLSKGHSLTGGDSSVQLSVFDEYISRLPDWVRPRWLLPSYLLEQKLRCRIQIFLAPSGTLIKTQIFESSGNDDYDKRALKAIGEAAPFPPVPEEIKGRVNRGDIILGFPL